MAPGRDPSRLRNLQPRVRISGHCLSGIVRRRVDQPASAGGNGGFIGGCRSTDCVCSLSHSGLRSGFSVRARISQLDSVHWEDGSQKKVCRRAVPRCNCKARILWSSLSTVVPLGDRWRWRGEQRTLAVGVGGEGQGSGVRGILFLSKARSLGPHRLGRGTTSKKWGQQGGNCGSTRVWVAARWLLALFCTPHHTAGVISPDSRPSRNPRGRET